MGKINSWTIIKDNFVKDYRVGSVGYLSALNKAGNLFVEIMDNLKDSVESKKKFNEDREVIQALLAKGYFEKMKGDL